MIVEQIYTGCLAEAAYYIESNGECAVIDPLRESSPYLSRAEKSGARMKYIFETHFHADFVSGHLELAKKSNATIVFGPNATTSFDSHIAQDGETFEIGKLQLKVLHTPGHTLESSTFLLYDEEGKEYCIFTGDTLFIGDVGRPDLAVKSHLSETDLAGMLFDSLRSKIMPLPDGVIVYPAHGAGSACGKNMSKETFDTLGHQKQVNYALQDISREDFIVQLTSGLLPPPYYFAKNVAQNKAGAVNLDVVLSKGLLALKPKEFLAMAKVENALLLDTRDPQIFCKAFIPTAINIGLGGQFAVWVGTLIQDFNKPILLICEDGKEQESITRLARVGYDNVLGYLEGGMHSWLQNGLEIDTIESITAERFAQNYNQDIHVIDVRKPSEFESNRMSTASNFPLDFINENMNDISREKKYFIHCAGGYRSMVAASILKTRGFNNIVEVAGGFTAISKTNIPLTNSISPCNLS